MKGLVYILFIFIISACAYSGDGMDERLDSVQRLMSDDPGAAFDALKDIDVSAIDDSATMARWALLYGEAMLANKHTAPTDTIINVAIEYYGTHGQKDSFDRSCRIKALLTETGNCDALATALYLQKEREFMLYKERAEHKLYMAVGLFILFVALGVMLWQRQRIRINEMRNDALVAEASSLRHDVEVRSNECSEMASTLMGTLDSRFRLIDELCETYYESQGTRTERKAIADKVKSQIESLKTDEGIFAEMQDGVRQCRPGFLESLQEQCPDIKPHDYRLAIYLACRLSSRTIALLIGESMDVVYKRKSRLKARLSSLGLPNSDIF